MKKMLIWFFLFSFFFFPMISFADSGWDYDYGGGYDVGDYDPGSYDGGGDGYSSRGFSFGGSSLPISIGTIVVVTVVALLRNRKKKGKQNTFMPKDNNEVEDKIIEMGMKREPTDSIEILDVGYDSVIQKYLPNETEESLLKELYHRFVEIQTAWMDFDYETLKSNCTKELYESYHSDLIALAESNGKNILKDFEFVSSNIRNIEKKNGKVYLDMYLCVSFYDYVIDEHTNEILRGNSSSPVRNAYDLEFVMDLEGITHCPNCGSQLEGEECAACHTVVDWKKEHFVLNKKGLIRK